MKLLLVFILFSLYLFLSTTAYGKDPVTLHSDMGSPNNEYQLFAKASRTNLIQDTHDKSPDFSIAYFEFPFFRQKPLKAFPGAKGYGSETPAGRGGKILKVTNLKDSGRGSLRDALNKKGARIIVFEVSGLIELESDLRIRHPYCTIAGQTAPPPGITLINYGVRISSHDILMQHLRIRPGDRGKKRDGRWDNLDALQLNAGARNVVIDHISASWGIDENISTWGYALDNVTFSNCIISEGLHHSVHSKQPHSKGLLIGPGSGKVAIIGNLMAHNFDRVPQIQGGNRVLVINNVIYEGGEYNFVDLTDPYQGGALDAYFKNNIFIDGPATSAKAVFALSPTLHPQSRFYQQNNLHLDQRRNQRAALVKDNTPLGIQVKEPPLGIGNISVLPVAALEEHIFATAGARPAERGTPAADPVDERIVAQVRTRTGQQIDCVEGCVRSAPGGWPSPTPLTRPFAIPMHPHRDDNGDGYSNIEETLHRIAREVEN